MKSLNKNKIIKYVQALIFILITALGGKIVSSVTMGRQYPWYNDIVRPSWNFPRWVNIF
jgi:tryptophan-rich sensory protein